MPLAVVRPASTADTNMREEKKHALAALASLIENVLQPPTKKVVRLAKMG